jgi:hypothetical protein
MKVFKLAKEGRAGRVTKLQTEGGALDNMGVYLWGYISYLHSEILSAAERPASGAGSALMVTPTSCAKSFRGSHLPYLMRTLLHDQRMRWLKGQKRFPNQI